MTEAADTAKKRCRITVSGRVQGVYFRQSTQIRAKELGLRGWVKNRADGSVEILAEGAPGSVDALITWCQEGPPSARVDSATVREEKCAGELESFFISY